MYESSDSQFSKTTTEVQSGPDSFDLFNYLRSEEIMQLQFNFRRESSCIDT